MIRFCVFIFFQKITTACTLKGATILHLASKFDQVKLVEWLLQSSNNKGGKLAKMQTLNGATSLHFAVVTNSINSIKLLLEYVPSLINMQMQNGVTAIYLGKLF